MQKQKRVEEGLLVEKESNVLEVGQCALTCGTCCEESLLRSC